VKIVGNGEDFFPCKIYSLSKTLFVVIARSGPAFFAGDEAIFNHHDHFALP
jgi:hypothetical protein